MLSLTAAAILALTAPASDPPEAAAAAALDALHAAAARSDAEAWADRLAPGLVWVGNETSERWDRDAFLGFAAPVFARGEGWVYSARDGGRQRHVTLAPDPAPASPGLTRCWTARPTARPVPRG